MSRATEAVASMAVRMGGEYNPIDGVSPDISVFGVEFQNTTETVLAGVWAVALLLCVIGMAIGGAKWGIAKKQSRSDDLTEGADQFKGASVAFGITAALGLITTAVLAIV